MKKINLLLIGAATLMAMAACSEQSCPEQSSCPECSICKECEDNGYVTEWEIAEDANVFWTGKVVDGKPVGPGLLNYGLGEARDKFEGYLNDDWTPKYGRHTYGNNMYYEGSFEHNGDGIGNLGRFTWSTSGDYRDGNTYIGLVTYDGGFGNEGQYGATYCPAYWKWTQGLLGKSYTGLLYWSGLYGGRPFGFAGKVGEVGQGMFQYENNSIYTGDLRCDNEWGFTRMGWGWNEWIVEEGSAWITGGSDDLKIVGFEGNFSDKGWIDGEGTWYFKNASGQVYYLPGIWEGGNLLGSASKKLPVRFASATLIEPK